MDLLCQKCKFAHYYRGSLNRLFTACMEYEKNNTAVLQWWVQKRHATGGQQKRNSRHRR